MKLYDVKLLTVICEILVQKNVNDILTKYGAIGHTTYDVRGKGEKGMRGEGLQDQKNVKIEVVLSKDKLEKIIEEITTTLFADLTIIFYVSDVQVVRIEKFS